MNYTVEVKNGCIASINKCNQHYITLRYVLYCPYTGININQERREEIQNYLEVAHKFIEDHPTNCVSDFLTDKDFEETLEEAQKISSQLDQYFDELIIPSWITHKEDIMERYRFSDNGGLSWSVPQINVNINITKKQIRATTRKLKARWTMGP